MNENARRAYAAYAAHLDALFVPRGALPLPSWEHLNETHRAAWEAAAAALAVPEKRVGEYASGSGW